LKAQERSLIAAQDITVLTLAKVAESRDNDTGNHILRLRDFAQRLASELARSGPYADEIDETFLADLYRSSPLHDIGKVGIADAILLKPGPLTAGEFEAMKHHTSIGANVLNEAVLKSQGGGFLAMASKIAQFHHEWWNGQGYLTGLAGTEIPLSARIVAVADVFDALTSERPYKEAWCPYRAKQAIEDACGTQFDPLVVAAFDRCFDDILDIRHRNSAVIHTTHGAISFREYDFVLTN